MTSIKRTTVKSKKIRQVRDRKRKLVVVEQGRVYLVSEVAELLDCSDQTVRELIECGRLSGQKVGNKFCVYYKALEEMLMRSAMVGMIVNPKEKADIISDN